jgi:small ligand-binding sensory domain FIST
MTGSGTSSGADRSPGPACGVGLSTSPDVGAAVREASAAAHAMLGGTPEVAVVFLSNIDRRTARAAMESMGDSIRAAVTVGGTVDGVIAGGVEQETGPGVAVWLARWPGADIVPFAIEYRRTPDGGLFSGWPPRLVDAWPRDAAVVLLADPFSFPVEEFIDRLAEDHPGVPVVGGMLSGATAPGGNTLLMGGGTYDAGAVGFVVSGAVRLRPVVSQGCRPIGRTLLVTKAEENVIFQLGGRPAIERLQEIYETLDADERELVRSSLHVGRVASEYQDSFAAGDFLVRNVVGADTRSGVIAIGDHVRVGQTVQFHVRDAASADAELRRLLEKARAEAGPARPAGALVFSCNGRGSRLFETPHHDARAIADVLGPIPAAGFFAQGEIGPIGRRNCLHGFTASIAEFEPREAAGFPH